MSLVEIDDGFDFRVVAVDGKWIFRFARRAGVVPALETEVALLPVIAPLLPVAVPRFEYVSHDPAFVVYELIDGEPLVAEDPDGVRAFLDALHALDVTTLPIAPVDWIDAYRAQCSKFEELVFPLLDAGVRAKAHALFDEVESLTGFEPALVHSDLGPEHMLVRADRLVGVIDWGDTQIGDPALDYAWLLHGPFAYWEVDAELRRRAFFYHRLGPFYSVHYGVFTKQPDYVERALAELSSRL
jgi:aminoglycoside phosphotransferase (APT) family kinase protein